MLSRPVSTPLLAAGFVLALASAPGPAGAWTPGSQQRIAEEAARLTPPDFYRQLKRNRAAYFQGVSDPFHDQQPAYHFEHPDGGGQLDEVILQAVTNTIDAIRAPRPFNEIAYRAGVVSHYLADAYNPINCDRSDPDEDRYAADFLVYLESVEPRVGMVFYGFRPSFDGKRELPRLVAETFARSRGLYPLVGREYRRVSFAPGRRAFDDRSTAYAVAALAYSHAVSDIAEVLRYIWLAAGGIDSRPQVPVRGRHVVQVPRSAPR